MLMCSNTPCRWCYMKLLQGLNFFQVEKVLSKMVKLILLIASFTERMFNHHKDFFLTEKYFNTIR